MREKFKNKLKLVLALLTTFFIVELVAGFLTNSLALISDAGHMLTDIFAISVSIFGFKMAENKATNKKTYGFYRAEIIAAFINGVLLILISGYILIEAIERIKNPPLVKGLEMLIVASMGLVVNIIGGAILFSDRKKNLNMRSAYLHALSDALGSIGATTAGVVILMKKWFYADIIASLLISGIIAYNSIRLLKESINILMEGVPSDVDAETIKKLLLEIPDIISVHDLHIWTLASGKNLLTVHVGVKGEIDRQKLRRLINEIENTIRENSNIEHITVQIEPITFDAELIIGNFKRQGES